MIAERIHSRQSDSPSVGTNRRIAWALIALLFPLALASWLHAQERTADETAGLRKRLSIAVLGFDNQTDDPELAHWRGAAMMLGRSLKEAKAIQVLSDNAVRYALRQAGLRPGDPIDPNRARLMGGHIEAQRVVWSSYSKKADQWHVGMRVMNVATGAVSPELSAQAGDWFDLRDKLNEQILAELGITPSTEEKKKMAERWTRSAEALDWGLRANLSQEQDKPVSEWEMLCRKVIAADPNCAPAYCNLAATLATQGKFDLAEDAAQKALQFDPEASSVHGVLGWMYFSQKQPDRAEAEFRRACQRDEDSAESLTWLAVACAENGRRDEALGLWERAVSLDRTNALTHAHLANAYAARKQPENALRELEEARRYLPGGVSAGNALFMIGDTYRSLGRYPEAIESYERAMAFVRGLGINPKTIRQAEQRIQGAKGALTPAFIQAPMPRRYTEEELDEIVPDKLTESQRLLATNPFSCSDSMRQWAKELTHGADEDLDKTRAIYEALAARLDPPGPARSRTAREVFEAWKNPEIRLVCMDRAVLFVALARTVNVNAFFVHVTKPPDGTVMNHACAAVFLGDRALLVDPTQHWLGAPHQQYAILDDLKATAFLCFNNRVGDAAELAAYRAGLKLWPDSLQGRVFLIGALQGADQAPEARREFAEIPQPQSEGYEAAIYWGLGGSMAAEEQNWERAEECLLKSISICPGDSCTQYNLGRIYARQQRLVEARTAFRACLRNEPSERMAGIARTVIAQINEQIGVDSAPGTATSEPKAQ